MNFDPALTSEEARSRSLSVSSAGSHGPFLASASASSSSSCGGNRSYTKSWRGKILKPFVIVTDHVPDGLVDGGGSVSDFMTECCHRWLGALSRAFGGESDRRGGRRSQWDDCFSFHAKEGRHLAQSLRKTDSSAGSGGGAGGAVADGVQAAASKDATSSRLGRNALLYVDKRMREDVKVLLNDVPRSRPDCFNQPTVKTLMRQVAQNASGLWFGSASSNPLLQGLGAGNKAGSNGQPTATDARDRAVGSGPQRLTYAGFEGRLQRLLLAYLHRHHSPGYGQGMTPIAALLIACADCSILPSTAPEAEGGVASTSPAAANPGPSGNSVEDSVADALLLKERQLLVDSSDNIAFWLFCHLVANVLPQDFYAPTPTPMHGLIVEISVTMVLVPSILPRLHAALSPIQRQLLMSVVFPRWFASLFVDELPLSCTLMVFDKMYGEDGFDTLTYTAIALLRICSHHIIVQSSSNGVPDVDVSSGMSLVQVIKTVCAEVDVDNLAASIEWARKYISKRRIASVRRKAHGMIEDRWLNIENRDGANGSALKQWVSDGLAADPAASRKGRKGASVSSKRPKRNTKQKKSMKKKDKRRKRTKRGKSSKKSQDKGFSDNKRSLSRSPNKHALRPSRDSNETLVEGVTVHDAKSGASDSTAHPFHEGVPDRGDTAPTSGHDTDSTHDTIVFEDEGTAAGRRTGGELDQNLIDSLEQFQNDDAKASSSEQTSDVMSSGDETMTSSDVDDPNASLHTETQQLFDSLQHTTHFSSEELAQMQTQFRALSNGGCGISQSQLLNLLRSMQQTLPGILSDLSYGQREDDAPSSPESRSSRGGSSVSNSEDDTDTPATSPGGTAPWTLNDRSPRQRRRKRSTDREHPVSKHAGASSSEHGQYVASDVIAGRLFQMLNQNASGHVQFQDLICVISALARGTVVERLRIVFDAFDVDGSGFLNAEELQHLSDALGFAGAGGLSGGSTITSGVSRASLSRAASASIASGSARNSRELSTGSVSSGRGIAPRGGESFDGQALRGGRRSCSRSFNLSMLEQSLSFNAEVSRRSIGIARSRSGMLGQRQHGNRAKSVSLSSHGFPRHDDRQGGSVGAWQTMFHSLRSQSGIGGEDLSSPGQTDASADPLDASRIELNVRHSRSAQRLLAEMTAGAAAVENEEDAAAGVPAGALLSMASSNEDMVADLPPETVVQDGNFQAGSEGTSATGPSSQVETVGDEFRHLLRQFSAVSRPATAATTSTTATAVQAVEIPPSHTAFSWQRHLLRSKPPRSHTTFSWSPVRDQTEITAQGTCDGDGSSCASSAVAAASLSPSLSPSAPALLVATAKSTPLALVGNAEYPAARLDGEGGISTHESPADALPLRMSLADRIHAMVSRDNGLRNSRETADTSLLNVTINPHAISFTVFSAAIGSDPYLLSLFDNTADAAAHEPTHAIQNAVSTNRTSNMVPQSQDSLQAIVTSAADLFGWDNHEGSLENAGRQGGSYFMVSAPGVDDDIDRAVVNSSEQHAEYRAVDVTPVKQDQLQTSRSNSAQFSVRSTGYLTTTNSAVILDSPADARFQQESWRRTNRGAASGRTGNGSGGSGNSQGSTPMSAVPTGYSPPPSSGSLLSDADGNKQYGTAGRRDHHRDPLQEPGGGGACCKCVVQ